MGSQLKHKFFAGDNVTIADFQIFYELSLFSLMCPDLAEKHPVIGQWYQNVIESSPRMTEDHKTYFTNLERIKAMIPADEPIVPKEDVVVLYYNPISQPARALKLALDLAIPGKYTIVETDLFNGGTKTPEFQAINPMGLIPCLTVNGHAMNESAAILRYVGAKYNLAQYPNNPALRHKVDMQLDFNGNSLRPALTGGLRKISIPQVLFGAPLATAETWNQVFANAQATLEKLANQFTNTFLASYQMTIADLQCFFEVTLFVEMSKFDLSVVPKINNWFKNMCQQPEIKAEYEDYKAFIDAAVGAKLPVRPVEEKKPDTLEYYYTPLSQPSAAIKTVLDIAGAHYNPHILNLMAGDNKTPEFLAINPFGQVPTLVFNGASMIESASILRFLCDKYELHHIYPQDATARHTVDSFLD